MPKFPALLPGKLHVLRHGSEPEEGQRVRKVMIKDPEGGPNRWDGTYEHQSGKGLVFSLVRHIRSQGVWDPATAFTELMSEHNVGGAWLRRQDDPRAEFEVMWERSYVSEAMVSFEELTRVLLARIEREPGVQLVLLREDAAARGWKNRGKVDDLLAGLVQRGDVREERTFGPGGGCTSRRFWRTSALPSRMLARGATRALSLSLLAVGQPHTAKGHRTPAGSRSFLRLMSDKKLMEEGRRILRSRLRREGRWTGRMGIRTRTVVRGAYRALWQSEINYIVQGLDGLTSPPPQASRPASRLDLTHCLL